LWAGGFRNVVPEITIKNWISVAVPSIHLILRQKKLLSVWPYDGITLIQDFKIRESPTRM
jgi:hypothetical protein